MAGGGTPQHRFARLRPALGETIIGAGVLVLAIVMVWQTLSIPVSPIYAKVGPTIVPIITACALGMLGVLLLVDALHGGWQSEDEKEITPDRRGAPLDRRRARPQCAPDQPLPGSPSRR